MFCARQMANLAKTNGQFLKLLRPQTVARSFSASSDHLIVDVHDKTDEMGLDQLGCNHDHLIVDVNDKTGVATMKLNRPPANSLNLDFLTELTIALEKLENEKSVRGLILTSSNNKIFSAGLDISEMYKPDRDRLAEFWKTLQGVWIALTGSRLATIAAINGHSPAGGCLLAMACDYRMMAPNFTIGLNETQLGIIPPFWFIDAMLSVVGQRQTEICCEKGLMMTSEQALKIGLIDEIVTHEVLLEKAANEMKGWLQVKDFARILTKNLIRKPMIDKLIASREEDIQHFINFITKDSVQEALGGYFEALKSKSKKKAQ